MITDGDFTDEQLLLTTAQAAKVLNVGRTTIYQLIKQGDLRPIHLARSCRISWAELERFVARLDGSGPEAEPPTSERRWRRLELPNGRRSLVAIQAQLAGDDSVA